MPSTADEVTTLLIKESSYLLWRTQVRGSSLSATWRLRPDAFYLPLNLNFSPNTMKPSRSETVLATIIGMECKKTP